MTPGVAFGVWCLISAAFFLGCWWTAGTTARDAMEWVEAEEVRGDALAYALSDLLFGSPDGEPASVVFDRAMVVLGEHHHARATR